VAIDAQVDAPAAWQLNDPAALTARRQYVTAVVRQRLHQHGFRERVLRAYQQCCAICRLRHDELLEAAHILPDIHPFGEPVVPNGLALCKLHHVAFDANIIGVTPDPEVTVRLDVLQEIDGPMLQHGLQGFQGRRIHVPRADDLKPNSDFLAER
jgi:putative restriction endonuclease